MSFRHLCGLIAVLPVFLCLEFRLPGATVDSWINSGGGSWGAGSNWSSNTPPASSFSLIAVTNAGTKTVTIDSATPSSTLSINKLTVGAPVGSLNTLQLQDATIANPLQPSGTVTINAGGSVVVNGSAVNVDGTGGAILNIVGGDLQLNSGVVDCSTTTSVKVSSGDRGAGTVGINGGTFSVFQLHLGAVSGSTGQLTISNGVLDASSLLSLGQSFNSTGVVTVAGGQLRVTNDLTKVGNLGSGTLEISGGLAHFAFLSTGENYGSDGTVNVTGGELRVTPRTTNDLVRVGSMGIGQLNISAGTHVIGSEFHLADDLSATGLVAVTGGKLIVTNDLTAIGRYGFGQLVASNSFVQLTNASVGRHPGAVGVLSVQSNAVVTQLDDLSIGRFPGSVGHVLVDGGLLALTNDNVWIGREGTGDLTVNSGTVSAGAFFIGMSPDGTNVPDGTLRLTGGSAVLSSNIVVGTPLVSTGHVAITGGRLAVVGESSPGYVSVVSGDFAVSGGDVSADELLLTNANGQFTFSSGALHLKQATVANGTPFVIGDGSNPATLELLGGTFRFADGLVVSPNATIIGCGTILGTIVNNGTISTNCESGNAVTLSVVWSGNGASVSFMSRTGVTYTLEYKDALTDANWVPQLPGSPGTGGLMVLSDPAAATTTRFYRVRAQ